MKIMLAYTLINWATKLRGIPIEQAGDRALDAVPVVAIAAVGKKPQGQNPPGAAAPCTETAPTGSSTFRTPLNEQDAHRPPARRR